MINDRYAEDERTRTSDKRVLKRYRFANIYNTINDNYYQTRIIQSLVLATVVEIIELLCFTAPFDLEHWHPSERPSTLHSL
jgi:hypothetical protein